MISLLMRLEFTGFLPKWRWKKAKIWLGFLKNLKSIKKPKVGVGHNIILDYNIVGAEFLEKNRNNLQEIPKADTMELGTFLRFYQEEEEEGLNLQN